MENVVSWTVLDFGGSCTGESSVSPSGHDGGTTKGSTMCSAMVYFNCGACGEALKKNQVDKHLSVCRNCQVVSCVDCNTEFWGDDYQKHTKCITEAEKYSGKNYVPKVNKGEAKQDKWLQQVQSAIDRNKSDPKVKRLLLSIKDYPNIPRKRLKFENFLANSLRIHDKNLVSHVWDILMVDTNESTSTKPPESVEPVDKCPTNSEVIPDDNNVDTKKERGRSKEKRRKNEIDQMSVEPRRKKKHRAEARDPWASSTKTSTMVDKPVSEDSGDEHASTSGNGTENHIVVNGKDQRAHKHAANGNDKNLSKKEQKKARKDERKRVSKKEERAVDCVDEVGRPNAKKRKQVDDDDDDDDDRVSENGAANRKPAADRSRRNRSDEETSGSDSRSKKQTGVESDADQGVGPGKTKNKKFDWEKVIIQILKTKGELSLKKLKKKVLAEYAAQGYIAATEEKLWAKYVKKITKSPLFKVVKERVKLSA